MQRRFAAPSPIFARAAAQSRRSKPQQELSTDGGGCHRKPPPQQQQQQQQESTSASVSASNMSISSASSSTDSCDSTPEAERPLSAESDTSSTTSTSSTSSSTLSASADAPKIFRRGVRARVLYDFRAGRPGELSVRRGDLVRVLYHVQQRWAFALAGRRRNRRSGYFPFLFAVKHDRTCERRVPSLEQYVRELPPGTAGDLANAATERSSGLVAQTSRMEVDQQRLLPTVKRRCNVVAGSRDSAGSGSSDSGNFDASSSNSSTNSIAASAAAVAAAALAASAVTGASSLAAEATTTATGETPLSSPQNQPRQPPLNCHHQQILCAAPVKKPFSPSKSAPATPQRSLTRNYSPDAAAPTSKPAPSATVTTLGAAAAAASVTTASKAYVPDSAVVKVPSTECDSVWQRRPSFDSLPLLPLSAASSILPSRSRQSRAQAPLKQQQQGQPWRQPAQRRVGQLRALLAAERRQRSCSPNGAGSSGKKVVTFSANNEIIGVADNIDRLPYLSTSASSSKPDGQHQAAELPPELANRLDSLSFYDNYLPQVRPADCEPSRRNREAKRPEKVTDDLEEHNEEQGLQTLV